VAGLCAAVIRFAVAVGAVLLGVVGDADATPTVTSEEAERQLLERAVLRFDDLPPGWAETVGPRPPTALRADVPACSAVGRVLARSGARADAPSFVFRDLHEVSSIALVAAGEAQAAEVLTALTSPDGEVCLSESFRAQLRVPRAPGGGVPAGAVTVRPLGFPTGADHTAAYRLAAEDGASVDVVGVRVGRTVTVLFFVSGTEPLSERVSQNVADRIVERLRSHG
jgi:hypothetical protein